MWTLPSFWFGLFCIVKIFFCPAGNGIGQEHILYEEAWHILLFIVLLSDSHSCCLILSFCFSPQCFSPPFCLALGQASSLFSSLSLSVFLISFVRPSQIDISNSWKRAVRRVLIWFFGWWCALIVLCRGAYNCHLTTALCSLSEAPPINSDRGVLPRTGGKCANISPASLSHEPLCGLITSQTVTSHSER